MGELHLQIVEEVTDHIKKELLTAVPARIDQLSSESVEALRSRLHILHYYCSQRSFDSHITNRLQPVLETSQRFWELLISESSQNGGEITLEKAAEIGEKIDRLLRLIVGDDMSVAARVMLLSQIYILLLRLSISKILMALEEGQARRPAPTEA